MNPEETTSENTKPVDETEISDTELENISGGVAHTWVCWIGNGLD
jgi:bacteriocin-like protein